MISSVQFIHKKNNGEQFQDQIITGEDSEGFPQTILGKLSSRVLKQVEEGRITLIFGYGDLNLTPLVSALMTKSAPSGDVLIGIPKGKFQRLDAAYHANFFSLIHGNGRFFYKDIVWCSARLENDSDYGSEVAFELTDFKTKPKWGDRNYRRQIDQALRHDIATGEVNRRNFIITFSTSIGLPELIMENPVFTTRDKSYHLRALNPAFLILESVDDVIPNISPLVSIIRVLLAKRIGSIIHFSWPYPLGLDKFFEQFEKLEPSEKARISLFHMGRTLCVKSKETSLCEFMSETNEKDIGTVLRDHPAIKELSIEGGSWDSYYPDAISDVVSHTLIYLVGNVTTLYPNDYSNLREPSDIDRLARYLREELSGMRLSGNIGYILSFLPFVDSFVLPSEFKVRFNNNGMFRRLGLRFAIEIAKGSAQGLQELILNSLLSIVNRLSMVKDIDLSIQGLKTPAKLGKSTALMSYLLLTSFTGKNASIVVCEYSSRVGLISYSSNYFKRILEDLKNRLPFQIDTLFSEGLTLLDSSNFRFFTFEPALEVHELDYSSKANGQFFEIRTKLLMRGGSFRNCLVQVYFESLANLRRSIGNFDVTNMELLLPGPIPLLSYEKDFPRISKGLDVIFRPFKKVVFFSYNGDNFRKTLDQLSLIRGLLRGDSDNIIVRKDFTISKKLNNVLTEDVLLRENLMQPESSEAEDNEDYYEGPLDAAFINASLDSEEKNNPENAKTLKELWNSISKSSDEKATQPVLNNSTELIKLTVRFDGVISEEDIWIRKGSYVRVVENDETQMVPSEELVVGQRIAHMESGTRESLDDSFVREYTSFRGITVASIFESFECLRRFCNVLFAQDFEIEYSYSDYADLYWLSDSQKHSLYDTLRFLTEPMPHSDRRAALIKEFFENSEIWPQISQLSFDNLVKLKRVFETVGVNDFSLHIVAVVLGMNYKFASFRQLLNELNTGTRRYYFEESDNLLAVSLLIINHSIEDDYEELTNAGKEIRVVLQLVGRSIQRVIRGGGASLNEMDNRIRENVRLCRIVKVN